MRFDFFCPIGRDARRDRLSHKLGCMPGNTVAVSFAPYVPDRAVEAAACKQMQFSLNPSTSLPPRLGLSHDVSKTVREAIRWDTMSVEMDYLQLLGAYFREAERREAKEAAAKRPSLSSASRLSWAKWYTSA